MIFFDKEQWHEVFVTLNKNRFRAILTACGIVWGVFMLIVMLGFGNGVERSIVQSMSGTVTNSIYIWGETTSIPYDGLSSGKPVTLTNDDVELIAANVHGIEHIAPRNQLSGYGSETWIRYKDRSRSYSVIGEFPQMQHIQPMKQVNGRFINELDIEESRKVVVIGRRVADELFVDIDDPTGLALEIDGIYFYVIGVLDSPEGTNHGDRQISSVFIPFTTFQRVFNYENRVGWLAITVDDTLSAETIESNIKRILKKRHRVNPIDNQAIGSFNAAEAFGELKDLFTGIHFLIWFVGGCTLLAGIIGVGNIMLITMKERTREIGIRKALGATPWSIVSHVLQESFVLTSIAGYIGLLLAIGTLELATVIFKHSTETQIIPQIDFGIAMLSLCVISFAGILAGVLPARASAQVNPVIALAAN